MQTQVTTEPPKDVRQPKYRDLRLNERIKALHAVCKDHPAQTDALKHVEHRLAYLDGLIGMWDDRWARQALAEYRRGALAAASLSVSNIFDTDRRLDLLRQFRPTVALIDTSAAERLNENAELERTEVVQ